MRIRILVAALLLGAIVALWGVFSGSPLLASSGILVLCGVAVVPALGLRFDSGAVPDTVRARQSESILEIAHESMSLLGAGLTPDTAAAVCALILHHTGASAVAMTDRDTVLGFEGVGAKHHKVGGPIVTQATRDAIKDGARRIIASREEIGCPDPNCELCAAVVEPLVVGGNAVGTLKFYYTDARDMHETSVVLAEGLGKLFSMQLELDGSRRELAFLADHDPLTGLGNRRRFETELSRELAEQRRLGGSGAVLWFDLDNFKDVNDRLGHAAGDELLASIADVLRHASREYDVAARLGGDEFGMIVAHADEAQAVRAASRLLGELSSHAFKVGDQTVRVTASMGMVHYPDDGNCREDLLTRADLAMYEAKAMGGNQLVAYDPASLRVEDSGPNGSLTAADLADALRSGRLVLQAQPIRSLVGGNDVAHELLPRMVSAEGELLPLEVVAPIGARAALLGDLDRWVVRRAITLLAEEQAAGRDTVFAVSLSQHAFADVGLLEKMRGDFAAAGAHPSRLVIQISEAAVIGDIKGAIDFVRAAREVGCRLALDKVGSGSSLVFYLKHLGVDFLKFDSELVKGLELSGGPTDALLIRALVDMCKALRIPTAAGSVENANLMHMVAAQGVDYVQGDEVGRPLLVGAAS